MTTLIQATALPGGLRLPYVEYGDPDGVPVLMLHGLSDSWHSFAPVLPHLPERGLRAIAVTQRGHGEASKPDAGYAMEDFAADAIALLDALGIERAIVVGHSLGAFAALHTALAAPDRVAGLVIAAGAASGQRSPVLDEIVAASAGMTDPIDEAFVRELQSGAADPDLHEAMVAGSLQMPARVWHAAGAGIAAHSLTDADLRAIACPTLLIWGDRDEVFARAEQDHLAATIPGARLVVYPGAQHNVHWADPPRFARDVAAFAATLA